jgi:hypothetical protein
MRASAVSQKYKIRVFAVHVNNSTWEPSPPTTSPKPGRMTTT